MPPGPVKLCVCKSENELLAVRESLGAARIAWEEEPEHLGGPVVVWVDRQLLGRAQAVTLTAEFDELEPDYESDVGGTNDELVAAGRFETARELLDAGVALEAMGIEPFPPPLVARGNLPRGSGPRFVMRVRRAEADRAAETLRALHGESISQPCCPKCAAWSVSYAREGWIPWLLRILHVRHVDRRLECSACGHFFIAPPRNAFPVVQPR